MNKNKKGKNETGNKLPLTKGSAISKPATADLNNVLPALAQQVTVRLTELRFTVS